jgi:hypothetical protein
MLHIRFLHIRCRLIFVKTLAHYVLPDYVLLETVWVGLQYMEVKIVRLIFLLGSFS